MKFVLNPRLAGIKFDDGMHASMWISRVGLRLNDRVQVQLHSGVPGANAVYEEIRRPV